MNKKTITYLDWDNQSVTEDFHFNLNKAEIAELEADYSDRGGLQKYFEAIIEREDIPALYAELKSLIARSVGEMYEDGPKTKFRKSDEYSLEFIQSDAYSELFMELLTGDEGVKFLHSIIPPSMAEEIRKRQAEEADVSNEALLSMSDEEFRQVAGPEKDMDVRFLRIAYQRKTQAA